MNPEKVDEKKKILGLMADKADWLMERRHLRQELLKRDDEIELL